MSSNLYFGITIGPIYETISKAQKTREIWGASYMFSYLCKKLLMEIDNSDKYEILLPSKELISDSKQGVGLYPDRILLKNNTGSFEELVIGINKVKSKIADELVKEFTNTRFTFKEYTDYIYKLKKDTVLLKQFFVDYFKTYAIEVNEEDLDFKNTQGKNIGIVKSLNLYLDYAELRPTLAHLDPDPFVILLNFINHSFLVKDAFHANYHKRGFPSLTEIATHELRFIAEKQYDEIIDKAFKDFKKQNTNNGEVDEIEDIDFQNNFDKTGDGEQNDTLSQIFNIKDDVLQKSLRTYHQYIAIVHADGDKMGKVIGSLNNSEEILDFSKNLLKFADEANKILAGDRFTSGGTNWGYGAAPIYIGGDDLVFFAPVASTNKGVYQTIFDLINKIDIKFNEIFNNKDSNDKYERYKELTESERPCMTYGVAITYYKFPLREAFELSKQLMINAKDDSKYGTRNRINFTLLKHSKQTYNAIIDKNNKSGLDAYLKLLSGNVQKPENKDADIFLNSIGQVIAAYPGVFIDRSISDLTDFFEKQFNEPVHKKNHNYLREVKEWIQEVLDKTEDYDETLTSIQAQLKFIHFIRDNEFKHTR